MTKEPYGLYWVDPADIDDKDNHYLVTPDYALVYTQMPPLKGKEVSELLKLPELARVWLSEEIEKIRRKYILEHRKEIAEQEAVFAAAFKEELEAERKKLAEAAQRNGVSGWQKD